MRKKKETNFISTKNKKLHNWSMYYKTVFMMKIKFVSDKVARKGYLTDWSIEDKHGELMSGCDRESFFNATKDLINMYGLERMTNLSAKKIVIYIDRLDKIRGFFNDLITEDDGIVVTLEDLIEFREYGQWIKSDDIKDMQEIVDNIFIPEKYFYLTPNQRTRKLLLKDADVDFKELYPDTFNDYKCVRKSLFGGICYCPYPGVIVPHPMICLDIKSAYIFSLLIEPHICSKAVEVDPSTWEYYINNPYEQSLGFYTIHYSTSSNIISCYKDKDGNNLTKGEHTVEMWLDSVDIEILRTLPYIHVNSVECTYLEQYEMQSVPRYVMDRLVHEYVKKSEISEEETPILYHLQKVVLNGIYGNTIKKVYNEDDYKLLKKTNALAPQWGIWTTSYTKKLLLGLATKLTGWYYSDTDSIYCLDTHENREIVKAYNDAIAERVKDFCSKYGYDFEQLHALGSFDLKYEIKKFKALKQKEYLFTTKEDKMIVKAAGCNKDEMVLDDHLYDLETLPVGNRIFPKLENDSYWEKTCDGDEAIEELFYASLLI